MVARLAFVDEELARRVCVGLGLPGPVPPDDAAGAVPQAEERPRPDRGARRVAGPGHGHREQLAGGRPGRPDRRLRRCRPRRHPRRPGRRCSRAGAVPHVDRTRTRAPSPAPTEPISSPSTGRSTPPAPPRATPSDRGGQRRLAAEPAVPDLRAGRPPPPQGHRRLGRRRRAAHGRGDPDPRVREVVVAATPGRRRPRSSRHSGPTGPGSGPVCTPPGLPALRRLARLAAKADRRPPEGSAAPSAKKTPTKKTPAKKTPAKKTPTKKGGR